MRQFLKRWSCLTLLMCFIVGVIIAIALAVLALAPIALLLIPLVTALHSFGAEDEGGSLEHDCRRSRIALRASSGYCAGCYYFNREWTENCSILGCAICPSAVPNGCNSFKSIQFEEA